MQRMTTTMSSYANLTDHEIEALTPEQFKLLAKQRAEELADEEDFPGLDVAASHAAMERLQDLG